MIDTTNNTASSESKKTIGDYTYNSINPYIPAVVEYISEKRHRKAAGVKWDQVLNDSTGELESRQSLILGEQKRVDSQEFYKLYSGSVKSFYNLSNKTMDLFEYIMSNIRYGADKICIPHVDAISTTGMSSATYFRCILQLLNAKIIAKADSDGCYYINPAIAFKGDRITLVKQYILDNGPTQLNSSK